MRKKNIHYKVRLRPINLKRDMSKMLKWYSNKEVLYYSEGHTTPYNEKIITKMYNSITKDGHQKVIKRMHDSITKNGHMYIIEILSNNKWLSIGDASFTRTSTPITIGLPEYWGKGIGSQALGLLIKKAKHYNWKELKISGIATYNKKSLQMYKSAGFKVTNENKKEVKMILKL